MKTLHHFALITLAGVLLLSAGCAHDRYASGQDVISSPPVVRTTVSPPLPADLDAALATRVRQQINQYGNLAAIAPNLQITADNGTVTLTGMVPSDSEKQMLHSVVRNTPGVRVVNDQLQVVSSIIPGPAIPSTTDTGLETRITQALQAQAALSPLLPSVQVRSQNGTVILSGIVPSLQARESIDSVVRNTPGVVAVNNQLQVAMSPTGRPAVLLDGASSLPGDVFNLHVQGLNTTDRGLAQQILEGLRTDTLLPNLLPKVDINVANGKVTLQGTVQSERQKQAIASAVQRAAGAENVQDRLQVLAP